MRSRGLALVIAAVAASAHAGAGTLIERVLADVAGEPVLLSEVALVERLKHLDRGAALESVLDQRLMYQEAVRLPQAALSGAEAQAACEDLTRKAPELADDPALCALARREAVVLKYVGLRFAPEERAGEDRGLDARIEEWVKDLRSAATIRYNAAP